jgi:hypothetical protein
MGLGHRHGTADPDFPARGSNPDEEMLETRCLGSQYCAAGG